MPIFLAYLLSLAGSQEQGFAADPKLAKAIALTENAVPISTFVADLAKETGVTLTCDSRIRDDLVVVVTKERPAKTIMQVVANHFDWRWTPTLPGAYKLEPSDDWIRKVREGIPGEMKLDWRRNRERALRYANELSRLDPVATEAKALAVGKAASDEEGGFYRLWEKRNPLAALVARTLGSLTDAQLASLRNRRIVMSTSPKPFQTAMPGSVLNDVAGAVRDFAGFEQRMFAAGLEPKITFDPDAVTEMYFDIHRASGADYVLLGANRQVLYKGSSLVPTAAKTPIPPLPSPIQEAIKAQKTPPDWMLHPEVPLAGYSELATKVAKKLNCDLVSDAYDFYYHFQNDPTGWNNACVLVTSDGWLKVRARRWIIFRSQTIPRHIWAQLGGRLPRNLTLDEKSQLITKLESEQYRSPLLGWLVGDSAFYRFWAATSPSLRRDLLAGQNVNFAQLPSEVHEFLYMQGDSGPGDFFQDFFFDEPEFAEVKPDQAVDGGAISDSDYAGLYPNWVAKDASLNLRSVSIPGVYLPGYKILVSPGMLTLSPADLQQIAAEPEMQGTKPILSETNPMRFRFYIGPRIQVDHHEVDFKLGREVAYDPSTWPKDLVERIRKGVEKRKKEGRADQQIGTVPP